jgi:hypothetical protein
MRNLLKHLKLWHALGAWIALGAVRNAIYTANLFVIVMWSIPLIINLLVLAGIVFILRRHLSRNPLLLTSSLMMGALFACLWAAAIGHLARGDMDFTRDFLAYPFLLLVPVLNYAESHDFLVQLLYYPKFGGVPALICYLGLAFAYSWIIVSIVNRNGSKQEASNIG